MADKEADKGKADAKKEGAKKGAEGEGGEGEAPAKKSLIATLLAPKMLMFIGGPVVLLLVGLGVYMFLFSGGEEEVASAEGEPGAAAGEHGEGGGEAAAGGEHAEGVHPTFVDVEDILVNVSTGSDKPAFLKLAVSLEVESGGEGTDVGAQLEALQPRIKDQLQTYLRELRVEDLTGSASVFRLKEELLRRINLAVEPIKVKDVLFREMIIQ